MADVRLDLSTISGGDLGEEISQALDKIAGSYDDESLEKAARTLTIKVTFQKANLKSSRMFLDVTSEVTTKLPVKKRKGIAWVSGSSLMTEELCRESNQMEIPGTKDKSRKVVKFGEKRGEKRC